MERDRLCIKYKNSLFHLITPGTDHSREYVPFLAYGKSLKGNINLGTRKIFADMGQTIAEIFSVEPNKRGEC